MMTTRSAVVTLHDGDDAADDAVVDVRIDDVVAVFFVARGRVKVSRKPSSPSELELVVRTYPSFAYARVY